MLAVNPFTAPACKISGLEDARTPLQTVVSGTLTDLVSLFQCYEFS